MLSHNVVWLLAHNVIVITSSLRLLLPLLHDYLKATIGF